MERLGAAPGACDCALGFSGIACRDHSFQRDDAIAAIDEIRHGLPVERVIGPQADPPSTTVRRHKKLPAHQQSVDILWLEAKGDRRTSLDRFEGDEHLFACLEVGMSP